MLSDCPDCYIWEWPCGVRLEIVSALYILLRRQSFFSDLKASLGICLHHFRASRVDMRSSMTTGAASTRQEPQPERLNPRSRKNRIRKACENRKRRKTKCKDGNYICVTVRPAMNKFKDVSAG